MKLEVPAVARVYRLRFVGPAPSLDAGFDHASWQGAETADVAHFRPEGSAHRPRARARLAWSREGFHGIFHVEDRDTRGLCRSFMDPVYEDSCVEFFVQPGGAGPYFNFEFSGGGGWLATRVTDPSRAPGGALRAFAPVDAERARRIRIHSTMPPGETAGPVAWTLSFHIPWAVMDAGGGAPVPRAGDLWRGNFYKCGDRTKGPHWAAWAPVPEVNFHLPACFGALHFT